MMWTENFFAVLNQPQLTNLLRLVQRLPPSGVARRHRELLVTDATPGENEITSGRNAASPRSKANSRAIWLIPQLEPFKSSTMVSVVTFVGPYLEAHTLGCPVLFPAPQCDKQANL